jgi:uncharacterized protein (DUF1697 family)
MKFVAFFRNVNLGQGINPTRPQLATAFVAAGAPDAASFQTAGTVVFAAEDETAAEAIVAQARETLFELRGLREPAYLAPLDHLIQLVAQDLFAGRDLADVLDISATLAPRDALATLRLPLASPRGDVEVIHLTPYLALTLRRQVGSTAGSPTPFFEKLLGVPATTRGWSTIVRLVKKHAAPGRNDALQE